MVESLMLIALGFLTATLFAIIAIQFVWRRAVAVTTARLNAEFNVEEATRATDKIASLEAMLEDKRHEVAELASGNAAFAARNADLEQSVLRASEEAANLRRQISDLEAQCETAHAETERNAQSLAALQSHADAIQARIGVLEQAASTEIARQAQVQQQLKTIGEKAARLVYEMNEAFGQAADTVGLQAAVAAPLAPSASPDIVEPAAISLTPFPADRADGAFEELNAIKASLSSSFGEAGPGDDEDDGRPLPSEHVLAERIKALEAGVAS
ncbi:hypothetical protein [Parvibaculum sp.]|uniref:hypothetical protein n=1 Tax=Parvibaculum sp. TaxID=2024848 RepID=UPI002BF6721F|nr:hypothetical protein [Parvibaculum sp.]HUD49963.1 hypothetical protein [Parvibaculum sp.]